MHFYGVEGAHFTTVRRVMVEGCHESVHLKFKIGRWERGVSMRPQPRPKMYTFTPNPHKGGGGMGIYEMYKFTNGHLHHHSPHAL